MLKKSLAILYQGQTTLEYPFSGHCPLCGTRIKNEDNLSCSGCNFRIETEAALKKLLDLGYELLPSYYKTKIPLDKIILQEAEIPQLSRVIILANGKALIQLNLYWVNYLNQLDLGRKKLSFWICVLLHEILHLSKLHFKNSVATQKINLYQVEEEVREKLIILTGKMKSLYEEYRDVLKIPGLPAIECESNLELCKDFKLGKLNNPIRKNLKLRFHDIYGAKNQKTLMGMIFIHKK